MPPIWQWRCTTRSAGTMRAAARSERRAISRRRRNQPDFRRADRAVERRIMGADRAAGSGHLGRAGPGPRRADARPVARRRHRAGISPRFARFPGRDELGAPCRAGKRLSQATAKWVSADRGAAGGPAADRGQRVPRRAGYPAVRSRCRRLVGTDGDGRSRAEPGLCRWTGDPAATLLVPGRLREARPARSWRFARPRLPWRARSVPDWHGNLVLRCSSITAISRPPPGRPCARLQRHRPVSALAAPGNADLSAHVDFAAFADAARTAGAEIHGPMTQGRFLAALGAGCGLRR